MKSKISEPESEDTNKSLKTFSSFDEADAENARSMAQISSEEHLRNVTERIQKMYAEELKNPMDKKIKFRK